VTLEPLPSIGRPTESEYAPFFAGYVSLVPEADILVVLESQRDQIRSLARAVPSDKETFAYAPGKWTVRQVFGHVADAERVFGHRAFCISRGEEAVLPSFDENSYAARSPAAARPLGELAEEIALVRASNLVVLGRLDEPTWRRVGTLASGPASVRALAYIMAGHLRHHLRILGERYSVAPPDGDTGEEAGGG
jgi:hypothetical protein